jgi:hypothetical protein
MASSVVGIDEKEKRAGLRERERETRRDRRRKRENRAGTFLGSVELGTTEQV